MILAKFEVIILVSIVRNVTFDTKLEVDIIGTLYGVARISTGKQNTDRQIRNILNAYPNAVIIKETYTGTKLEGRKDFENLIKVLKEGDTLVFDSVSRMSRNSKERLRTL